MKTSVIIPNYNGIAFLPDCLTTLEANRKDGFDFEIILVDNGSADKSVEYVKSNHPEVVTVELKENTGFAAAVNRGIESALGEYVLLLNNDIKVYPDFVKNLENAIEADDKLFSVNSVMLSMSNNEILDGAGDYYCALGWAYAYGKGKNAQKLLSGKKRNIFSACGGASIYRKKILDEIGVFDEEHFAYLEDIDLGYRARIYGYKSILEPSAVCEHAGSGFSGSRYNEFKIDLSSRNSIYLIHKNMPLLQKLINLPFLIIGFAVKTAFFALKGYGKVYVKGLIKGFKLSFSKKGRAKKVPFRFKNLGNLFVIQLLLWINIIRRPFA